MFIFEKITVGNSVDLHAGMQIALVNMPLSNVDVKASFMGKPTLTRHRFSLLSELLNRLAKYKTKTGNRIDLVVFPEVCIPHSWESMIVSWSRRHNVAVIIGLEHRIDNGFAYNEVLAALPYKGPGGTSNCLPIRRLKKFYAPDEVFELENNFLEVPSADHVEFQLIQWRGASFAIYNCYELTSLEHRGIFKGKVDFIICTEFNRDVNYFSNIVESVARDVHCYVVQVNDSQFGDSRVIRPSSTLGMNPVRIKGGDNLTFLTTYLDLKALREHQYQGYGLQKGSLVFKATPPGFNPTDVRDRINLLNKSGL
ncbi:MAG: hypothetical protein RR775_03390 [Massilia sp.]|uniref:hypothetical protein n=1 Tax=Massilia sp. TaxID=1882437 RepID=UPI002FCB51CB